MHPSRRTFLHTTAAAATVSAAPPAAKPLDASTIARRHNLVRTQPTPDFFEGLLLGNGDIGVCVVVRPDALGLHIGKNDAWDIRVSEDDAASSFSFTCWAKAAEIARKAASPARVNEGEKRVRMRFVTAPLLGLSLQGLK